MTEEMSDEVSQRVLLMQVATVFGLVALFLSILGTYGLLAYEVSLREKEIGIRLALGSSRERIVCPPRFSRRPLAHHRRAPRACQRHRHWIRSARPLLGSQSTSLPVLFGTTFLLLGPALAAIPLRATRASRLDPVQPPRRD
jgi:hypothetical protein